VGRIVTTAVVFGALFLGLSATGVVSPFGLWFFMGWSIVATMVLKQTWQGGHAGPVGITVLGVMTTVCAVLIWLTGV
jgi:hypothetical protein